MRQPKRITIFAGHFGSGKTELAVNYALWLGKQNKKTAVIDFDVVNPYYRSKDAEALLGEQGIQVISSPYANTNLENPAVPAEINAVFEDSSCSVIVDVGGDDDGAIPLGSIHSKIAGEDYDLFFVLNERRMLTQTVESAMDMLRNIETVSRLKATGIINNTHLKEFTQVQNVLDGQALARQVSEESGLPILYVSGTKEILEQLPPEYEEMKFPLDLFLTLKF